MTGALERWDATLDTFEETLEGYIAMSVAANDPAADPPPPPPAFVPPDDLPPLPDRLRLRAVELAARSRLIEAELARVRDETATELNAHSRPKAIYGHEQQAHLFDTTG